MTTCECQGKLGGPGETSSSASERTPGSRASQVIKAWCSRRVWRIENTFKAMTSSDSYSILMKMAEYTCSSPFYGERN